MGYQTRISILTFLNRAFLILLCLTTTSCGGNLFEEASGKSSEDSILEEIQKAVNEQRFDDAILLITENPDLIPETRENKMLYASAYAGKCGVTFTHLAESIKTATDTPILAAMTSFSSTTTSSTNCVAAQEYLESIGVYADRTVTENFALFLIGFSKLGIYLKEVADDTAPYGTVDADFDGCTGGNLPDENVKQMMSGTALMIENYDAIEDYLSSDLQGDLTTIAVTCGAACTETDADAIVNATYVETYRSLIESNEYGVGSCALVTCCP